MPKLPKGMFKRGGAYYVRDRRGSCDKWMSLGPDYGDAVHRLRQFRRHPERVPNVRLTVRQAADRWLTNRIQTGRNEKGLKLATARVRRYLEPFMGHHLLSKVTPELLRNYRVWLEQRCRSTGTVYHVLGDARSLFYWCEEVGLIDRAPVPRRWLPRLKESVPDRLDDTEVARLVQLPDPHGFVIRFGLGTGLRWSELCRAQAHHVDRSGMLVVGQTKSGKVRRIPLPAALMRAVRQRVGRLVPFAEGSPGAFTKVVRVRSGVLRFHPHQLRHTFACQWLEKGGSLAALQELLGHASIVTTQRYARLSDDLVRREVERLASG